MGQISMFLKVSRVEPPGSTAVQLFNALIIVYTCFIHIIIEFRTQKPSFPAIPDFHRQLLAPPGGHKSLGAKIS